MTEQEYNQRLIRHGEVIFVPIDTIPADAIPVAMDKPKEHVVGHSKSGHHHVAVADVADAFTVFRPKGADSEELYLRVTEKGNPRIEHRKTFDVHESKPILKGDYIIQIACEFNYAERTIQRDRD